MTQRRDFLAATAASAALAGAGNASAQLKIDVTGVGARQIPVAIAAFSNEPALAAQNLPAITDVVRADLVRCGLFRIVDGGNAALDENSQINYADWKSRGADALAVGSVTRLADGRYDVRFRLHDVARQQSVVGSSFTPGSSQIRLAAHKIADQIYEKLTGDRGIFATRIAYVLKRGTQYQLQVADSDGENALPALTSGEPIISPAWNPDGTQLAYVSFERRKPIVYAHSLPTGQRRVVAEFRGSNSAPAWSPDGRTIAVTLTLNSTSQIYLLSATGGGAPRRITSSSAIDTEAVFSPDGGYIYFTSDRSGGPQIYRMPVGGGDAQRLTFKGDYHTSPRLSGDGKQLSYVARREGRFRVAVMDLATSDELLLTEGPMDESPSFAPNGRYLLYATTAGGRDALGMVSTDGRIRSRLTVASGDVREPTWGPFMN
ncbi:Tol-Pal system beta propeller repeat protein TolB [Derxia lacustris]|uniref:Tol-Pal system beta propeller repeat protein TolB n=1 Tax=Derxia lacustris TaxID=764842 RepID=UPI000A16FE8E|nr:Tol-Pal system beta propeller repeat protein TolB [Derxia lacustris]